MAKLGGVSNPIRAIVVDDSATARELLVGILQIAEGIQVVGVGETGEDAVRLVRRMKPNVLLMDINMPALDGFEATRRIMHLAPTPIVLVTGTFMHDDVDLSFNALRAGALTVIAKPGLGDPEMCDQVVNIVRSMAQVPVVRRWASDGPAKPSAPVPRYTPPAPPRPRGVASTVTHAELARRTIIGIASSTGGPGALARILKSLPASFPLPILLVQHVTLGFATGFAEWLDSETALPVRLAGHGEKPLPGTVLVAPDDYHLQINFRGAIELYKAEPYHGLRPSANYLFRSLARIFGPRAMGIVLTGMGDDGAEGLTAMHEAGALTVAQDEASCVVYGMPREAVLRGAITAVLSLDEIAATLQRFVPERNHEQA